MAWMLRHKACNGVAFYHTAHNRPLPNSTIFADDVVFPDGSAPKAGDDIKCGSCKAPLEPWELIPDDMEQTACTPTGKPASGATAY